MPINPYDDTLDTIDEQQEDPRVAALRKIADEDRAAQDVMLRTSLRKADRDGGSPEQAAEAYRLANKYGLSIGVVSRNFDLVKRRDLPAVDIARQTPAVAQIASDPDHAPVVKDDLPQLGALEWVLKMQRQSAAAMSSHRVGTVPGETTWLSPEEEQRFQAWARTSGVIRELDKVPYDWRGFWQETKGAPFRYGKDHGTDTYKQHGHPTFSVESKYATPNDPTAGRWEGETYIAPSGQRINMLDERAAALWFHDAIPPAAKALAESRGLTIEAPPIIPGMPISPQMREAVAGTLKKEGEGLKEGKGPSAPENPIALDRLKAGVRDAFLGLWEFGKGLATDVVANIGLSPQQRANEAAARIASGAEPVGFSESIARQLVDVATAVHGNLQAALAAQSPEEVQRFGNEALRQVATLPVDLAGIPVSALKADIERGDYQHALGLTIGTASVFAAMGSLHGRQNVARAARAAHALDNEAFLDAVHEAVQQSKTAQRSPEVAQKFIEAATKDTPHETVFIPIEPFVEHFTEAGLKPADVATMLTGKPDALQTAVETGADLAVPTARYATLLSGTDHAKALAPEVKLAPGELSAREAGEVVEQLSKPPEAPKAEPAPVEPSPVPPVSEAAPQAPAAPVTPETGILVPESARETVPLPAEESPAGLPAPPEVKLKGPRPGTPEFDKAYSEADALERKSFELYTAYRDAEDAVHNAKPGSKARDAAQKRATKAGEAYNALGRGAGDNARKARYEMNLQRAWENPDTPPEIRWGIADKLRERTPGEESPYTILMAEAERRLLAEGATELEAKSESSRVASTIIETPLVDYAPFDKSIPAAMRRIVERRESNAAEAKLTDLEKQYGIISTRHARAVNEASDAVGRERALREAEDYFKAESERLEKERKAEEQKRAAEEAAAIVTAKELAAKGRLVWRMWGKPGEGNGGWRPIEGSPVKIASAPKGYTFSVFRDGPSNWHVIEDSTGLSIGEGRNRADTIKLATERLAAHAERFPAIVKSQLEKTPPKPTPGEQPATVEADLPSLPEKPFTGSGSTLAAGVDPGLAKFYEEDISPYSKAALAVMRDVARGLARTIVNVLEPALRVRKVATMGEDVYANAMKMAHRSDLELLKFGQHESKVLDTTINEAEQWFQRNFTEEQLRDLNLSRGVPQSLEAFKLQEQAKARLMAGDPRLRDINLPKLFKEVSDYAFDLGHEAGFDIPYFEDYFYGTYKPRKGVSKEAMDRFLKHWVTTERWMKDKILPTVADAAAAGFELRHQNPIANIRAEVRSIAQRAALKDLRATIVQTEGAAEGFTLRGEPTVAEGGERPQVRPEARSYATWEDQATPTEMQEWVAIKEPLFKGLLFDPRYARLINNLISTNAITRNRALNGIRQAGFGLQTIKFFGSMFHYGNMLKGSLATEMGGLLNPKGYADFAKAHVKAVDRTTPEYHEYVSLGGGHTFSIEAGGVEAMNNAIAAFARGNRIGALLRLPKAIANQAWIPASPGFVRWMFDTMIPDMKYLKWRGDVAHMETGLGRPLSAAEKIEIIRRQQNFHGEMNERLFGRSGTVTSALRLVFMAPGYGEGNFRTILKSPTDWRSARFVAQTIVGTAITAAVATKVLTGEWPDPPQQLDDVRDLFKVKTPWRDAYGRRTYFDLMTYDKDYWTLWGNLATAQPGKIGPELQARVGGATASHFRFFTDLSLLFQNRMIHDYWDRAVWKPSDSFPVKVGKFIKYEGEQMGPISTNVAAQSAKAGMPPEAAAATSLIGLRPTVSEEQKRRSEARRRR